MKLSRDCFVNTFPDFALERGLKWIITITTAAHISKGQEEPTRSKYF